MQHQGPVKTKPARSAPPHVRRSAQSVFIDLALLTKFVDPALAAAWGEIAGADLAALCRPGRMTGGRTGRTLEVVVPNGSAAAKVQFEAEGLRRRLNAFLGPDTVGRIAIRQSGRQSREPSPDPGGPDAPSPLGAALGRFRASFTKARGGDR